MSRRRAWEKAGVDDESRLQAADELREQTAWGRNLPAPLRRFLRTEVSGALVLVAAGAAALAWVNSPWSAGYDALWSTELSVEIGEWTVGHDLRGWVNDGLMAFFFFVIGLEVRREFDMGELGDRRRVAGPALAAVGGMLLPVAIYLAFTRGTEASSAWGIVMPTDTALRWESWRSWGAARRRACAPSSSRSSSPTTWACWS